MNDIKVELEPFAQLEPDGIMTVKFKDPIAAQACIVVRLFESLCVFVN